ncbi:ribosome biogenesis/translation initiation ATPase RLI [Thermogymnomonas acidicola]|uniref:Ribosome biogenesis/translation initiation ATPase RLI n=1 Tax=Thermogymnomonas acidicola TaxID=399579 RepID=A0AA37BQE1_9ARCH|nr:ribosome biogenesis/translation initiation ATPase RLI [Thermogymnomonas acidicola]
MHIAVLRRDRCHPKKCNHECQYYCPPVRSGTPTIEFPDAEGQPLITEKLCIGCGICVRRCPFGAITIVGIPDELEKEKVHQFSENSFRLYSLPVVQQGKVTAILGQNGMGKSTTLSILAGNTIPNFGNFREPPSKDDVVKRLSGTVMGQYFRDLYSGRKKVVLKSQYVDLIPRVVKGRIRDALSNADQSGRMDEVVSLMSMEGVLDKDIDKCSGGELQKLAISVALLKDADVYLMDEMSSYLDITERLRVARVVQELARDRTVLVVEHDLAIMDWMADAVHIVYGKPGAYGVITEQKSTNKAVNEFLSGYLREENVRIRESSIDFQERTLRRDVNAPVLVSWENVSKTLGDFTLRARSGSIRLTQVVGVLGRNGLGKTSFVKILAGIMQPDTGAVSSTVRVAYKPQYISVDYAGTVADLIGEALKERSADTFVNNEIMHPLQINELMDLEVEDLSGGELQRLSIAITLARDADLFLLDEPSAHLDSAMRMEAAKVIRRVMENNRKSALVVDHDVYFIDLISDSLMVFRGEGGRHGEAFGPMDMRSGMNMFLSDAGVTFRRDQQTKRPRINKPGSSLDRSQRESGEYYFS